jgi:gliding motility-associated-like protein
MAGILILSDGVVNSYREFIQNKLIVSLEHDRIYKISFYYSVDAGSALGGCPPNQFGVFGSESEFKDTSAFFLSHLIPLGTSDESKFVDDTLGWYQCEIIFKANGGENYLTIGNFQDSSNTTFVYGCDTTIWNGLIFASDYYYLDDFSVTEYFEYSIPNVFTPNHDNINNVFYPNVTGIEDWEMTILNRWGNKITTLDKNNPTWSGEHYEDGVYFFVFKSESKNINAHSFFHLVR